MRQITTIDNLKAEILADINAQNARLIKSTNDIINLELCDKMSKLRQISELDYADVLPVYLKSQGMTAPEIDKIMIRRIEKTDQLKTNPKVVEIKRKKLSNKFKEFHRQTLKLKEQTLKLYPEINDVVNKV